MKRNAKVMALMLAVVMVFAMGFSACSKEAAPDDGQNPAMNFVGFYVCDRANILISPDGEDGASAIVTWNNSAWESSSWMMSGTFDAETLQFEYHDCVKTDYVYGEDGEVTEQTEVYKDGNGLMKFSDGDPLSLTWQDDQESIADGMVFEYSAAEPEGENAGMANPWSDVDSAEAAAEGAGLDMFMVPDGDTSISLGEIKVDQYRYMDGIAEARIEFPAVSMTIRKGKKTAEMAEGDISGDYNEYEHEWTQNIKGLEVNCFGNREGEATKTIWSLDDTDYSITVLGLGGDEDYGLSPDDLNSLINGIQ